MAAGNTSRTRREELRIEGHEEEEWQVSQTTPAVGDTVRTVEGVAEVVRVLGKVSDGSRLLELKFTERDAPSYFAATSNVLQQGSGAEPGQA